MRKGSRATLCLIGSAAVHAGLVAALAQPHAERGAARAAPHTFQVRLVAPDAAPAPASDAADPTPLLLAPEAPLQAPDPAVPPAPASQAASAAQPEAAVQFPEDSPPAPGPLPETDRPRYYLPSELNERPRLAEDVKPDLALSVPNVPPQVLGVRLMINRDGTVDDVVIEGAAPEAGVRDAVVRAFRHIRFSPGKIDGIVVNSQVRIEVHLDTPPQVLPSEVVH